MNSIRPNIHAKKYQPHNYKGYVVQPHPNAASVPIYGVRKPGERLFTAGPFATGKEAESWIDAHPLKEWNTYRPTKLAEDVAGWSTYQKTAPVFAKQMGKPFRVTTKEGPVSGKAGDYLCLGVENEAWPVDQDIFEKTMKKIATGVSRLREIIRKHGSGYRLVSHKGKNLGDFSSKAAAEKHEREVEYFKRQK